MRARERSKKKERRDLAVVLLNAFVLCDAQKLRFFSRCFLFAHLFSFTISILWSCGSYALNSLLTFSHFVFFANYNNIESTHPQFTRLIISSWVSYCSISQSPSKYGMPSYAISVQLEKYSKTGILCRNKVVLCITNLVIKLLNCVIWLNFLFQLLSRKLFIPEFVGDRWRLAIWDRTTSILPNVEAV